MPDAPRSPTAACVQSLDLGWIAPGYGSVRLALEVAEQTAARLLSEDGDGSLEWAESFIRAASKERHFGDCPYARSWERGPATCSACVYDEFMLKAWKRLEATHA